MAGEIPTPAPEKTSVHSLEREILDRFPAPVAIPYRRVQAQRQPVNRLNDLFLTFNSLIRYCGLVLASSYLHGDVWNEELTRALDELGSPTLEGWDGFFDATSSALPAEGIVGEMRSLYEEHGIDNKVTVREIVAGRVVEKELGYISHLIHFERNLPRNLALVDDDTINSSFEFCYFYVQRILESASFLKDYPLLWTRERTGSGLAALELMGSREPFAEVHIPENGAEPLPLHQVLLRLGADRYLSLHPFVAYHDCYFCLKESSSGEKTRELFLYQGKTPRRIYYRGTRHKVALREYRPTYQKLIDAKWSRKADETPGDPEALGAAHLEAVRQAGRDRRILVADSFRARPEITGQLEIFLYRPGQSVCLLVGEKGSGKTTLLLDASDRWAQSGHRVTWPGRLEGDLETAIAQALGWRAAGSGLVQDFCAVAGDARRWIIVLDGPHDDPSRLLGEAARFAARHGDAPVKLIVTLRPIDQFLLARGQPEAGGAPDEELRFGVEDPIWPRKLSYLYLGRVSAPEVGRLFEALKKMSGHCPGTPFHQLRSQVKELLRLPSYAHMLTSAFHRKEIPEHLSVENLMDQLAIRRIFLSRERRDLLGNLVGAMRCKRTESIDIDSVLDLEDESLVQELLRVDPGSPFATLVGERILVRASPTAEGEDAVRFRQGPVFDFLLYRHLYKQYELAEDLFFELCHDARPGLVFEGSLLFLISRLIATEKDRGRIGALLDRCGPVFGYLLGTLLARLGDYLVMRDQDRERLRRDIVERIVGAGGIHREVVLETAARVLAAEDRVDEAVEILEVMAEACPQRAAEAHLAAAACCARTGAAKAEGTHLWKAYKLAVRQNDHTGAALALRRFASRVLEDGSTRKALGYARKALAHARQGALPAGAGPEDGALPREGEIACLWETARCLHSRGMKAEAAGDLTLAVDLAKKARDKGALAHSYLRLANLEEDPERRRGEAGKALRVAREIGDWDLVARVHSQLGRLARRTGPLPEALAQLGRAAEIRKRLGEDVSLAACYADLADLHEQMGQPREALEVYEKALAIYQALGSEKDLAYCYNRYGSLYYAYGDYDRALSFYGKSLELRKKLEDAEGLANSYNNIGMVYKARADYVKAMEYFKKSTQIKEKLKDSLGLARTYNHIALLHGIWKEYDKAFELLDRAGGILESASDREGLATGHNNRGLIYSQMEKWSEALAAYERAAAILQELGDKKGLAATYNNMALIHKGRADFYEALRVFEMAAAIQKELGDEKGLAASYNNMGVIHDSRGEFEPALRYYELDLEITQRLEDRASLATSYNNIAILHYNHRNYAKALLYLEKCLGLFEELEIEDMVLKTRERIEMVRRRM